MSKLTYTRADHVDWSVGADGRMTVKDTESNWFYPLNPVATLVWDLMDGTSSIDDMVEVVCATFDVDEDTARDDITEFVEQALDLNLAEESVRAGTPATSAPGTQTAS